MISHQITTGVVDTLGKPAVSSHLIDELSETFDGLLITDEIGMFGLRKYYKTDKERYVDVFEVDNDIVLVFHKDTFVLEKLIDTVAEAVKEGKIDEGRIDRSVKKILETKGYKVEE